MGKRRCKAGILGVREIIVPIEALIPSVNLVTIGCDKRRIKIEIFPHA